MLKSLFTGALFGFGFALALLFVFVIYAEAFFPERFEEPLQPEPAVETPATPPETRLAAVAKRDLNYAYYADSDEQLEIPADGGLLFISWLEPEAGAGRPDTVQIWLTTETAWLIRTEADGVEHERLPYPRPYGVPMMRYLLKVMGPNRGMNIALSLQQVTIDDTERLGRSLHRVTTGGEIKTNEDGVVYLKPDER